MLNSRGSTGKALAAGDAPTDSRDSSRISIPKCPCLLGTQPWTSTVLKQLPVLSVLAPRLPSMAPMLSGAPPSPFARWVPVSGRTKHSDKRAPLGALGGSGGDSPDVGGFAVTESARRTYDRPIDRCARIPTTAMFSPLYPLVPLSQVPELVLYVHLSQLETASRESAIAAPSPALTLRKR